MKGYKQILKSKRVQQVASAKVEAGLTFTCFPRGVAHKSISFTYLYPLPFQHGFHTPNYFFIYLFKKLYINFKLFLFMYNLNLTTLLYHVLGHHNPIRLVKQVTSHFSLPIYPMYANMMSFLHVVSIKNILNLLQNGAIIDLFLHIVHVGKDYIIYVAFSLELYSIKINISSRSVYRKYIKVTILYIMKIVT